jgi:hypothetical protein
MMSSKIFFAAQRRSNVWLGRLRSRNHLARLYQQKPALAKTSAQASQNIAKVCLTTKLTEHQGSRTYLLMLWLSQP